MQSHVDEVQKQEHVLHDYFPDVESVKLGIKVIFNFANSVGSEISYVGSVPLPQEG